MSAFKTPLIDIHIAIYFFRVYCVFNNFFPFYLIYLFCLFSFQLFLFLVQCAEYNSILFVLQILVFDCFTVHMTRRNAVKRIAIKLLTESAVISGSEMGDIGIDLFEKCFQQTKKKEKKK